METNFVLNLEKCHFMVKQGIVLGPVISSRGLEVDKSKMDIMHSLQMLITHSFEYVEANNFSIQFHCESSIVDITLGSSHFQE